MPEKDSPPELVPDFRQGKYSDGHPLDDVHYLECKIILKPDRFTSKQGFVDFAKLVSRAAEKADVDLSTAHHACPRGAGRRRSSRHLVAQAAHGPTDASS